MPPNYVELIIYNCAQLGLKIDDLQYLNDEMYIELTQIHKSSMDKLQSNAKNGNNQPVAQTTLKRIRD